MSTILITGTTNGIGKETAKALAKSGHELILINRNKTAAQALQKELKALGASSVHLYQADLSLMKEVKRVANEVLEKHQEIDVLLNNAGLIAGAKHMTLEGIEVTLATNHLAPVVLTGMLLPAIQRSKMKRVVNVASEAHKWIRLDPKDLNMTGTYEPLRCYGNTKLMNILHIKKLVTLPALSNISCYALHPGAVRTRFGDSSTLFMKLMIKLFSPIMLSAQQGAETSIYLCTEKELNAPNGSYFVKSKPAIPQPSALDTQLRDEVWDASLAMLRSVGIETERLYHS
jgi:retinol dehydrogenase 12